MGQPRLASSEDGLAALVPAWRVGALARRARLAAFTYEVGSLGRHNGVQGRRGRLSSARPAGRGSPTGSPGAFLARVPSLTGVYCSHPER